MTESSIYYSVRVRDRETGQFSSAFVICKGNIYAHVGAMLKECGVKWSFSTEETSANPRCLYRTWFNGKYGQPDCQDDDHIVAIAHEIYP